jgi:hypothetical protein
MAREKSSAFAHPPTRRSRRCEVCGASSHEKTLVGLRNDRRKDSPRFCLPHHPESMAGSEALLSVGLVGALS